MAVDTRNERAAGINLLLPWSSSLPENDGDVDVADRQQHAWCYPGILAAPPYVAPRVGQGAHKELIVQTLWQAPKRDVIHDPALDRAIRTAAGHLAAEVKATQVKLDDRVEKIKAEIQAAADEGVDGLIDLEMELLELEEDEEKLKGERKAIAAMRTQKSRALANQASAKKRARDEKKKKQVLRQMAKARAAKKG